MFAQDATPTAPSDRSQETPPSEMSRLEQFLRNTFSAPATPTGVDRPFSMGPTHIAMRSIDGGEVGAPVSTGRFAARPGCSGHSMSSWTTHTTSVSDLSDSQSSSTVVSPATPRRALLSGASPTVHRAPGPKEAAYNKKVEVNITANGGHAHDDDAAVITDCAGSGKSAQGGTKWRPTVRRSILKGERPRETLSFTGRFAGGLRDDIKRRGAWYLSDWTDAFTKENRSQSLASTVFLFFACLTPAVTFGMLFDAATDGQLGIVEMVLSTALSGLVFSLFSGQPIAIMGERRSRAHTP